MVPKRTIPFTPGAYDKLQSELKRLTVELEAIKLRVTAAREMGDLSENGAYHYGKFELGSVGRQLRHIQYQLHHGYVMQKPIKTDTVGVGCTVTLSDGKKDIRYLIVSQYEADPKQGKISMDSPVGVAIMGKKVGDQVTITIPVGTITYLIMAIS